VTGPHAWTGGGWDFSQCEGPYLVKVDDRMSRLSNIEETGGMTISFWVKGEYRGRTSRIMAGAFGIGTGKDNIWGGTPDYQTVQSPRGVAIWDKQWHHIAVAVDFRGTADNVRIHVDGQLVGTRSATYLNNLNSQVGRTWAIGGRNAHDQGFDYGALADIAFFDRVLSTREIAYLNAGPVLRGGYRGDSTQRPRPVGPGPRRLRPALATGFRSGKSGLC
jgi:hypothetical protein